MFRNGFGTYGADVTGDLMTVHAEVFYVGAAAERVDLAGENAGPACSVKGTSEPANSGKQIDETESSDGRRANRWKIQAALMRRPPLRRVNIAQLDGADRSLSPSAPGQNFEISSTEGAHPATMDQT